MNRSLRRRAEKIAGKSTPSGDAAQFFSLAVRLHLAGALDEACVAYTKASALQPAHAEAHYGLGLALHHSGDLDQAIDGYRKAIVHDPRHGLAFNNLSLIYKQMGRLEEAETASLRSLEIDPHSPMFLTNHAAVLMDRGESRRAIEAFQKALAVDPHRAEAHTGLGLALLTRGNFAEGWEEYEWRWRQKDKIFAWLPEAGLSTKPRWTGEALSDKTLMICAEQGLGDTIQFARYLPLVRARAKRIVAWVQPALKALLRNVEGVTVLGMDERVDGVDVFCPLLSLPRIFATTPQTIPPVASFFQADGMAVERWKKRVGQEGRLRIGLCWQGKPGAAADRGRSIPLAAFAPLARIPGVRLISLQKHFGTEQLSNLPEGMKVETLGDDFDVGPGAFMDTTAIMETLDLVVTSDTAIAHLAGSLRRPTWLMLQHSPDWRWGIGSTRSSWYPSMRLFRQTTPGDWDGVAHEITQALASENFDAAGALM